MEKEIWFRRKTYGYGWGLPCHWKGWLAFVVYLSLAGGAGFVAEDFGLYGILGFIIGLAVLTAGFIWLCYRKGEKPRWQWGNDD